TRLEWFLLGARPRAGRPVYLLVIRELGDLAMRTLVCILLCSAPITLLGCGSTGAPAEEPMVTVTSVKLTNGAPEITTRQITRAQDLAEREQREGVVHPNGDGTASTSEAITVDGGCGFSSMWMYDFDKQAQNPTSSATGQGSGGSWGQTNFNRI